MIFISRCLKCREWHTNKSMLMFDCVNGGFSVYEKWSKHHPDIHGPLCSSCSDILSMHLSLRRMQEQNCDKFNIINSIAANNPIHRELKLKGGGILRYRDQDKEVIKNG